MQLFTLKFTKNRGALFAYGSVFAFSWRFQFKLKIANSMVFQSKLVHFKLKTKRMKRKWYEYTNACLMQQKYSIFMFGHILTNFTFFLLWKFHLKNQTKVFYIKFYDLFRVYSWSYILNVLFCFVLLIWCHFMFCVWKKNLFLPLFLWWNSAKNYSVWNPMYI